MPPRREAQPEYVESFPDPAPLKSSETRGTALLGSLFSPGDPRGGYDSLTHAREYEEIVCHPDTSRSTSHCSQDAFALALPDFAGLCATVDRSRVYTYVDALPCDVGRGDVAVAWGSSDADATPARLTGNTLRQWSSAGRSVHLSALHLDSLAVRNFCWAVDAGWPSSGCCVAHFIVMSSGFAMPPHFRGEDVILIGLDGTWKASFHESSETQRQVADWYPQVVAVVNSSARPRNVSFDARAGRRPACYIPAGVAFDLQATADNCACLLLTLPEPLSAGAVVPNLAERILGDHLVNIGPNHRLFPFAGSTGREVLARTLEQHAAAIRDESNPHLAAARERATPSEEMLSFYRFDLTAWYAARHIDLEAMLTRSGGIVRIENFLPSEVAERCQSMLYNSSPYVWQENSGENPVHRFESSTSFPYSTPIRNMLARLVPHRRAVISAARYGEGDCIAPHNDKAYRTILGRVHSRTIAVVLHLSPVTWEEERRDKLGGNFVDLETGKQYAPRWNTLFAFTVPRQHEVTPVLDKFPFPGKRISLFGASLPRLSLTVDCSPFLAGTLLSPGWFLEPGQKYSLDEGPEGGPSHKKPRRRSLAP